MDTRRQRKKVNHVLDVSAAYTVITGSSQAESLIAALEAATLVVAPDLFYSEAANTAWKFQHIGSASPEEALQLYRSATQLVEVFWESQGLAEAALALACKWAHPAYDCFYIVLAQQHKATLLTKDKRLARLAQQVGVSVVGI